METTHTCFGYDLSVMYTQAISDMVDLIRTAYIKYLDLLLQICYIDDIKC